MQNNTRELLQLFVEKADEMMTEEFRLYIQNTRKISLRITSHEGVVERKAPSMTLIKSFATSYRLFISGESISIGGLKKVFQDNEISEQWKLGYQTVRESLNAYLDHQTGLNIGEAGAPVTPRCISNVFINGWIFHVNDAEKLKMYRKWRGNETTFHLAEQEFIVAMHEVGQAVKYLADLSHRELSSASL